MVGFSTAQLMWLWVETVCALGWEQKGYQILSQELQEESSLLFNHINHVSLVFRSLLTILIPCLTIVCTSIFPVQTGRTFPWFLSGLQPDVMLGSLSTLKKCWKLVDSQSTKHGSTRYPLVNCYIAIENGPFIVDFPIFTW